MATTEIFMIENPAIAGREEKYRVMRVDTAKILKSWKQSLYSFEWLSPDGSIRAAGDLPLQEHQKRKEIEKLIEHGQALERPVLGIGIMDNVEIGAGRAAFLTLAAHGHPFIEVYVPIASEEDFRPFKAH